MVIKHSIKWRGGERRDREKLDFWFSHQNPVSPKGIILNYSQDYPPIKEEQDQKKKKKIAVKVSLTKLSPISIPFELWKVKNGILFICITQHTGTQCSKCYT